MLVIRVIYLVAIVFVMSVCVFRECLRCWHCVCSLSTIVSFMACVVVFYIYGCCVYVNLFRCKFI